MSTGFRNWQLQRLENAELFRLAEGYQRIAESLIADAERIVRLAGDNPTRGQILRLAQTRAMLADMQAQLSTLNLPESLKEIKQAAWDQAVEGTVDDMLGGGLSLEQFATRNPAPAVDFLDRTAKGNTLGQAVRQLEQRQQRAAIDALMTGLLLGQSPEQVARGMARTISGLALSDAMRLARTEMMHSARSGSLALMRMNAHLVEGWIWTAAVANTNPPPCPQCFALHGSFHKLTEAFVSHPNCRCTPTPKVRGDDTPIEPAEDILNRMTEEEARRLLGDARYEAWKAGRIGLDDLIGTEQDGLRNTPGLKELFAPPPPRPEGIPEWVDLDDGITDEQLEFLRNGFKDMDAAFGDVPLPNISLGMVDDFRSSLGEGYRTNGFYYPGRGRITLNWEETPADELLSTLHHELGHHFDRVILGKPGRYGSMDLTVDAPGPLLDVFRAISASDRWREWGRLQGEFWDYARSPEEVWARAFAQYVAYKSGNQRLMNKMLVRTQWTSDDFAPIMKAMDTLFASLV